MPHSISIGPSEAADLSWVADCPEELVRTVFNPEIGTVRTDTGTGQLTCFGAGEYWSTALRPQDFTETSGNGTPTTLTARSSDVADTQIVSAYEPVDFDDFPFDEAGDVESFEAVTDGETFGEGDDESVY